MRTVAIGEVAEIVSGATPKTSVGEYWGGDVPWATPADLSKLDGAYIGSTPRNLTLAGVRSCATSVLPPGSVLLSSRAPIGHVAINTVPMATNQGFKSLVPGDDLDAKFLYHWLRANRAHLESLGNGATFKELSKRTTEQVRIPLPAIAEQRRIAAILDHADALRAKRRQVLAHLDALPQAIFHEMFSGLDLPEASGREAMPLIRNGVSPSTKGTVDADVLTLSSVTRGRFDPGAIKRATFDITPGQDKRVSATDFLMCRGNGNLHLVGRGVLPNADRPDLVFPDTVIAGRIDTTVVHPRYLETVWSQRATRDQIEGGARTTNGTHKINQQLIARVKIPIPPMENQREYARRVALVDEQRAVSVSALAQADELFASLQSRAFRGEL